ncbi:MAG TPA: DUF4239 domain-containing protein [Polymorphobacter sp.]|nr:DUF4239 domain-containing protein [Polymorphobacter sp.]
MINSLVDIMPIWAIGALLLTLIGLATALGGHLRTRIAINVDTFPATSASITMLSLLIGFTFSVALNRYDTRRDLVVEEAGALTMVWERVRLEPPEVRDRMQPLVQRYVAARLAYFEHGVVVDRERSADAVAEVQQNGLWDIVNELVRDDTRPLITRALIDAMTRVDDAAWRRESAAREHIPLLVIDLLILFSLITAAIIGYSTGLQAKVNRPINIAFFTLLTLAILMVLDLDRPRSGLVRVSQKPMLDLQVDMAADVLAQRALAAVR